MDLRLGRFLLVFVGTMGVLIALKQTELRLNLADSRPYVFWVGLFVIFWLQSFLVRKWCLKKG